MGIIEAKALVDIAQTAILVVVGIFAWVNRKDSNTNDRIDKVEKNKADKSDVMCIEHSKQIEKLKAEIKHSPGKSDLDQLHGRITQLNGEFSIVKGQVTAINNNVQLITDHLMGKTS